jgi:hypothetical protein
MDATTSVGEMSGLERSESTGTEILAPGVSPSSAGSTPVSMMDVEMAGSGSLSGAPSLLALDAAALLAQLPAPAPVSIESTSTADAIQEITGTDARVRTRSGGSRSESAPRGRSNRTIKKDGSYSRKDKSLALLCDRYVECYFCERVVPNLK